VELPIPPPSPPCAATAVEEIVGGVENVLLVITEGLGVELELDVEDNAEETTWPYCPIVAPSFSSQHVILFVPQQKLPFWHSVRFVLKPPFAIHKSSVFALQISGHPSSIPLTVKTKIRTIRRRPSPIGAAFP
jgi:hypothetical protein